MCVCVLILRIVKLARLLLLTRTNPTYAPHFIAAHIFRRTHTHTHRRKWSKKLFVKSILFRVKTIDLKTCLKLKAIFELCTRNLLFTSWCLCMCVCLCVCQPGSARSKHELLLCTARENKMKPRTHFGFVDEPNAPGVKGKMSV